MPDTENATQHSAKQPTCGIVMPISEIDNCPPTHWAQVLGIISEPLKRAGFETNLVSSQGNSSVIQKRIVQNLNTNDIVVCDVSGKNANVMLELGMRLAFDKPVVLVKDDKTSFSFDVSPIEHLSYPRDLRFNSILDFQSLLVDKVKQLHEEVQSGRYNSYLKSFGEIKVAAIDTKEVSAQTFIIEELKNLRNVVENISYRPARRRRLNSDFRSLVMTLPANILSRPEMTLFTRLIEGAPGVLDATLRRVDENNVEAHIMCTDDEEFDAGELMSIAGKFNHEVARMRRESRRQSVSPPTELKE